MGASASSLADCVLDGDIPALKTLLRDRPHGQQPRTSTDAKQRADSGDQSSDDDEGNDDDGNQPDRSATEWARQVEEAVHTAVAMEIHSPRELQQLQIALELLLLACPAAWSSRRTGSSSAQQSGSQELAGADDGQNNGDWTASHRACVTGNLSFVTFVSQQQQARGANETLDCGTRRDAFGLLPIDLVPPELLRSREEIAADLVATNGDAKRHSTLATTARGRRSAAIQWLRESKAAFETRLVLKRLRQARKRRALAKARAKADAEASGEGNNAAVGHMEHVEKAPASVKAEPDAATASSPPGAFFVEFEPSQERFAFVKSSFDNGEAFAGHIHDREAPLRVRFRVPRAEIFLQGYFQLIWRAPGEPRSEEPRYEPQVLHLRDELQRRMDQNPPLDPEQLSSNASDASSRRLVDDEEESEDDELGLGAAREVSGWFPLSVAHIPEDSVVNVLFVACDRNLLHRSVVLSTEGVLLQSPSVRDRRESSDYYDSSDDNSSGDEKGEEEDQEMEGGYRFVVGGEEFRHPSVELDGKEFADVAELEAFVQSVVAARKKQLRDKADGDKQHDARPSEPTDGGDASVQADGEPLQDAKALQSGDEGDQEGRDGGEDPPPRSRRE